MSGAPVRLLCVAGARPNFIKIAPLMRVLRANDRFVARLVHTGQHYDDMLSRVFFEELSIPKPDIELGIGSASHALQTAEIMKRFEPVLLEEQPHGVIVVGDVNSTIGCALVAAKFQRAQAFRTRLERADAPSRRRPLVIHVEAGLRSGDDEMPEEINRRLTDAISDLLFVSDPAGMDNLQREGAAESHCFFVGNVMIDTLLAAKEQALRSPILEQLGLTPQKYALITLHRPSNVDDSAALGALLRTVEEAADGLPLVFPAHPRTQARLREYGVALDQARWKLIAPLGYLDFLKLMAAARLVLTDSGGVQEETTVLRVPCVTLRDTTERPVTISEGTNWLAGTEPTSVRKNILLAMGASMSRRIPKLWDGRAAERIGTILSRVFTV